MSEQQPCPMCKGEPPDFENHDCMCGGRKTLGSYIAGMDACIQWWRKLHTEQGKQLAAVQSELQAERQKVAFLTLRVAALEEELRDERGEAPAAASPEGEE